MRPIRLFSGMFGNPNERVFISSTLYTIAYIVGSVLYLFTLIAVRDASGISLLNYFAVLIFLPILLAAHLYPYRSTYFLVEFFSLLLSIGVIVNQDQEPADSILTVTLVLLFSNLAAELIFLRKRMMSDLQRALLDSRLKTLEVY